MLLGDTTGRVGVAKGGGAISSAAAGASVGVTIGAEEGIGPAGGACVTPPRSASTVGRVPVAIPLGPSVETDIVGGVSGSRSFFEWDFRCMSSRVYSESVSLRQVCNCRSIAGYVCSSKKSFCRGV